MMDRQFTVISFNDLGDGRTELVIDVTMTCADELIPMAHVGLEQHARQARRGCSPPR